MFMSTILRENLFNKKPIEGTDTASENENGIHAVRLLTVTHVWTFQRYLIDQIFPNSNLLNG